MTSRDPNLFIIGFPKCGTTSVFTYLSLHPAFCGSSKKEPAHFFENKFDPSKYDLALYRQYFTHCRNQRFILEASVTHARGGRAHAEFLKSTFDNPKIVVMLREPTSRLYSYYHLCRDQGYITSSMTFDEFLREGERRRQDGKPLPESVWRGFAMRYQDHLFEWMDVFGENLFVGFFEHLKQSPETFCDALCAWLGVEPLSRFKIEYEVENKTINPRNFRLHRFARSINRVAEPALRRNRMVKRYLRRFYQMANARRGNSRGLTPDQQYQLDAMFASANATLGKELRRRRPDLVLPSWLEQT
jgi:hypothetical protein